MEQNMKPMYDLYLTSLSEKEQKAYKIAKSHLGMSFQLEKSIGFLKWLKNVVKDKECDVSGSILQQHSIV
jgi:hypothetical protein